jgi:hypothetical protein
LGYEAPELERTPRYRAAPPGPSYLAGDAAERGHRVRADDAVRQDSRAQCGRDIQHDVVDRQEREWHGDIGWHAGRQRLALGAQLHPPGCLGVRELAFRCRPQQWAGELTAGQPPHVVGAKAIADACAATIATRACAEPDPSADEVERV